MYSKKKKKQHKKTRLPHHIKLQEPPPLYAGARDLITALAPYLSLQILSNYVKFKLNMEIN